MLLCMAEEDLLLCTGSLVLGFDLLFRAVKREYKVFRGWNQQQIKRIKEKAAAIYKNGAKDELQWDNFEYNNERKTEGK